MTEAKIEDIEKNYQKILQQTGEQSFVNWEQFTKSSTEFMKTLEELTKNIAVLREIQHKRFINTMKKLKSADIPDLIKTVNSKKLPKDALKAILNRFKVDQEEVQLVGTVEELKTQSKTLLDDYVSINTESTKKVKETVDYLTEKIKLTGLYEEPVQKDLVSTFKHQFDEQILEDITKKIEIKYIPNTVELIHIQTYAQIIENVDVLVRGEYKRLTVETRQKQRKLIKDAPKYIETLIEYLTNTEVLINEGQKAIIKKLNISEQRLEESEAALMERGLAQNIFYIQSTIRSKVKQSIVASKEIDLAKAKEILQYQVTLLGEKVEYFRDFFATLEKSQENLQIVPMLLALSLNDMVFEHYGLEEEDIMKNVSDTVIMTNPDFTKLFKEMQVQIINLMAKIGVINEQAAQMMQNPQNPNLQQGYNSPLGVQGGVMPGNPQSDLLQMQQMQQFYQMQMQYQQLQAQQGKK